ncbi:UV DNA damage repair endonuclease UvsE [Anaeromicropila herbilytica]|uniref:DUF1722 domain-containing protein n=1 Tax=Anaeromicropila herbilytica TaxID=2785025 RepID=A0A7R7ENJ0_9FIRM|nr:UV DNA damage repair endonuclease UvsE [Anaeromicropila herbilytica]BCN31820.1 hypothetical protein bsdtb5_31150 [Anaeromicropila herbilytica]
MALEKRIGYACTPISIPYRTSKSFMLKNFNDEIFNDCVKNNIKNLYHILSWNVDNRIQMFRISSDIIPFGSHPVNQIKWWELWKEELLECGEFVKKQRIRVSMHPGQYTILNSPTEQVVINSIADLEYHCRFLDSMEVDYTNKIVLHVGGVYGNKEDAMNKFIHNFDRLSDSLKRRLVIENDDKSYTIEEVLYICDKIQVPAVFDNLHHELNPCSLSQKEILGAVTSTWKAEDGPAKFHYSEQDMTKKGGSHSKSVDTRKFLEYYDSIKDISADIMMEVKDKDLSAIKCILSIDDQIPVSARTNQWAKYKYLIMEKNYSYYKKCSQMINSNLPMKDIYIYMEECLKSPFDEGSFRNTVEHVYGYVKEKVTKKEKENFRELLENPKDNQKKIKKYLQKLCIKYDIDYMNQSYYFL